MSSLSRVGNQLPSHQTISRVAWRIRSGEAAKLMDKCLICFLTFSSPPSGLSFVLMVAVFYLVLCPAVTPQNKTLSVRWTLCLGFME